MGAYDTPLVVTVRSGTFASLCPHAEGKGFMRHHTVKMRTKKEPFFIGNYNVPHAPGEVKHFLLVFFRDLLYSGGKGVIILRIMAIDYGDARTGVAISDPTGLLAGSTTVIHSRKPEQVAQELASLVKEHGVEELVMGFPRNMDGTEGPRAELYRAFAAQVEEACGMKVALWDERRTTVEAHNILHASGKRMKDHRKNVDAVAATLILEGYLTFKRARG